MFINKKQEEMFLRIASHQDFGKKNPVEIGIEYGYSISEVEEMVNDLEDSNGKRYYFPIQVFYRGTLNVRRFRQYLLEVHTNNWTACVDELVIKRGREEMINCHTEAVRGKYCVFYSSYGRKEGYYLVDLEALKVIMFIPGSDNGKTIFLTEDAVLILKDHILTKYNFKKEKKSIKLDAENRLTEELLIEGKESYYLIHADIIWKIGKELDMAEKIVDTCEISDDITGIEYDGNEFFYYLKDDDTGKYKKYSEMGTLLEKNCFPKTKRKEYERKREIILSTRDYQLFRGDIYCKSSNERVASFDKGINIFGKEYDRNIFWGIKTGADDLVDNLFSSTRSLCIGTIQKIELMEEVEKINIPIKEENIIHL
mgnify:CR=1 FL=1